MIIRTATRADLDAWAALRADLWPEDPVAAHLREAAAMLARPASESIVLLAVSPSAGIRAFAEATLRHDHVNGCATSPVAFLEGIYVRPEDRGSGLGRRLSESVACWAREQGCAELASDATLENVTSHAFHQAVGFRESGRVVYFRMPLEAVDALRQ